MFGCKLSFGALTNTMKTKKEYFVVCKYVFKRDISIVIY